MKNNKLHRTGLALVVVLLVILAATAAGIYAVQVSQADQTNVMGVQFRQQAAYASHQAAAFLTSNEVSKHLDILRMISNANTVNNQRGAIGPGLIMDFSGLGPSINGAPGTQRLKGDLARRTKQLASISSPVLSNSQVGGFSDSDTYCNYIFTGESYSLFGRGVKVRGSASEPYYLLSDLNSRQTGFRREIGLMNASYIPCY